MATKTKIEEARPAVAGEKFTFRYLFGGQVFEVKPKGEGNSGQWVCLTCGLPFGNQIEKDCHLHARAPKANTMTVVLGPKAKHVLAWRSFISGEIEVP